ncbi:AAA family ATPase [Bartonella sp. CB60]|uniref:AAA family ATPase n=1 Tax=Bartonella sp. CB60 TaxID=3113619 RepID=UPI00300DCC84
MQFVAFEIKNFKGILDPVRIDMTDGNPSFPFILVGDNESGKTTILQGIHLIYLLCCGYYYEEDLSYNFNPIINENFIAIIRPKIPSFTGATTLTACLSYSENETENPKKEDITPEDASKNNKTLTVSFFYHFKGGKYTGFSVSINGKKVQLENDFLKWIKDSIPKIVYYSDFIYDKYAYYSFEPDKVPVCYVPDVIKFSKSHHDNNALWKNRSISFSPHYNYHWQRMLNNIFVGSYYKNNICRQNSDCDISFQKNIIECTDDDAVHQNLSSINDYLNSVIGESWSNITGSEKGIDLYSLEKKNTEDSFVNFQFRITSNNRSFSLREKSKGFRWFFCFKILTEIYAKSNSNKNGIIFLLDEPANHLHIDAQKKILNSLNDLLKSGRNRVIYSTHSPYLINEACENLFSVHNVISDNQYSKIICEKCLTSDITKNNEKSILAIVHSLWINYFNKNQKESFSILQNIANKVGYLDSFTGLIERAYTWFLK